ncbi:rhomboid family intramembrane serine protease [Streptomyces sp. WAC05374]|uniref:rhomboid family intramembrane serine protease n=1 Tax=Streptomyces sp. WAC05374 TaxID=2487420 RepID=UPI000F89052E|nr:rhomboid family intramembrane serine protease [Streptomyces sp. WAC05374]RST07585.1 rhomboid family intramembrane serine protease [Streptomyces sp. WAC05374]TDF44614.1 rhomboid family intramembrane serine protease [Streptomyces sp. WAC05374]TDF56653.1 rhomboid family intramembrane serine protease [Streptomyces sp. WAC05374]TDF59971.1 rhomboid family intramembrane serine protease [Streptomyces sp. WAC05374]
MEQAHLPGCYRHPGKETGIRCTRCERPICSDCMVNASVGFQCPECVRDGSGTGHSRTANQPRTIAGGRVTAGHPHLVTNVLIGLNLLVFLIGRLNPAVIDELVLIGFAFDPDLGRVVGVADGEWYRLVSSMFLHEEIWHVAGNMLLLWLLGGALEAELGRARYVTLYLLSGLAGSALTYLIAPENQGSLGASGAVYGLLGATVVLVRRLKRDMRPIMALVVLNLVITFARDGIAWEAHIGGLAAGLIIAYAMVNGPRERRALLQGAACALVLGLTLVTVVLRTAALT